MALTALLADRVCIVTGSAQGIGFEVARALSINGARVVIADIGAQLDGSGQDRRKADAAAARIQAEGGRCTAVATDVTDRGQVDRLVDAAVDQYGRVDVVVNAAGNLRRGSVLDMSRDDWEATFRIHVDGPLNTTQAVGQLWRSHPGEHRRIINLASDSGFYGEADYAAYACAKSSVLALTLSTAASVGELGATANVFVPQAMTRMTLSIPAEDLPDTEGSRWDSGEFDAVNVPPAMLFLASEGSDGFNGRVVGGWGFEVHAYSLPRRTRSLYSPGPWDLETLFARMPDLIDD